MEANSNNGTSGNTNEVLLRIENIEKKVNVLEERLSAFERDTPASRESRLGVSSIEATLRQAPPPPPPPPAVSDSSTQISDWFGRFQEWVKEDWLLKLGALLVLIGFGWLVSYAFLNNWIGPMGRITFGIAAGALILLLGWWRIRKYVHQGGIFIVVGSTTILLTIFAAREIYNFFTPFSALAIMFLSTAFVALASVKYNSRTLALASLLLASIAPLLTKSPDPNEIALFSYLFAITVGALWILALRGWRILTLASLVMISIWSAPFVLEQVYGVDESVLLLFAYAFAGVFFITNTLGILKLKGKEIILDLITAAGTGLFILVWILSAATEEWKSLTLAAWMLVFAVGSFYVFKLTKRHEPFYVYAGVGVAMLAAATAVELSGQTLTIAFTIEVLAIVLVAYSILRNIRIAERISLLFIAPIVLSFQSITSSVWRTSVFHKDFVVLFLLAVTLIGIGAFFWQIRKKANVSDPSLISSTLLVIGSLYAYVLLWLSLHATFVNDDTAVTISLAVYTITGLIMYFYGRANENKAIRLYGALLLGFVVGRLLVVDVWDMELTGRIVTFFLIGALLMSTAFIGRKKDKTPEPPSPDS